MVPKKTKIPKEHIDVIKQEFFNRCTKKWGTKAQFIVLMEECAELIVAVSHHIRLTEEYDLGFDYWDGQNMDELIGEIADVEVMIGYIKNEYNLFDEVETRKAKKVKRTEVRLNE